jgi:arylsulfatase A-like enzyme
VASGPHNKRQLPTSGGFQHFYGHVNGEIAYFTHTRNGGLDWQRNGVSLREEGYTTHLIANEAVSWLRQRNTPKPFFLYVPFNAPHGPLQVPPQYLERYRNIADNRRRTYSAMVECMDEAVGKIVDAAQAVGPTIILFLSDNGGPLGAGANNGRLRAGKQTVFEGGTRVPGILAAPGLTPRDYNALAHVTDLLPTLTNAAGIPFQPANPLDGVSHWPAIHSDTNNAPRTELFSSVRGDQNGLQYSFREGPWKLVRLENDQRRELLFHLDEDPYEQTDRLSAANSVANRLRPKLESWIALGPKSQGDFSGAPHPGYVVPKDYATVAVE